MVPSRCPRCVPAERTAVASASAATVMGITASMTLLMHTTKATTTTTVHMPLRTRRRQKNSANPWLLVPVAAGDTATEAVTSELRNGEAEQAEVTKRYDRLARIYDIYDAPMEWMGTRKRRAQLVANARGSVLEVGVGTGKNLPHYRADAHVTGIDVSSGMLERAKVRARSLPVRAELVEADVQDLPFDDDSFDTAVGTCVFCSVADPIVGLRELSRVVRPGGQILLLEHVRPQNRFLGRLADIATVLTRRVFGFRANRRTEDNVRAAGLEIVDVERSGIWRTIVARPAPVVSDSESG